MKPSRIVRPLIVGLVGAISLIAAGCTNSDAGARKAALMTSAAQEQPQKPIRMRYYGGPKSPMYPE
jgi:hypothetical protein